MFSGLSVLWLKGHPVRVYRPVELNLLSSKMADIYVLWLFQELLANYFADQSVTQTASCFNPLWQFVSQACCSATDAVGVRAPLRCSCRSAVMEALVGASYLWCGLGIGVEGFCKYVHIYCIHSPYVSKAVYTYSMLGHMYLCMCVCLSTLHISPISERILAAFLFKPLCASCATSTIEQPILYSLSVCYIVHTMHMVFGLRAALEISWVVIGVFFSPLLSSVGITARPGLFVSLAYHGGGSLAVMLRLWLSPLCCIRQQWDWVVCFISTHIKASTWHLRELFSSRVIEKVF